MTKHVAVAGKGGTGKTSFSALMIKYLIEREKGSILAVDADPNSNLNEALGLEVQKYISDILVETKDPKAVPPGMTKDLFIEYKLNQALTETEHLDLLVMGNPQGPGCYCYPNDLLRKKMETLDKNYDYLVMDNEAGLEHISRGIVRKVDILFVISDASVRSIRSAGRVRELVETFKGRVGEMYLIVTKVGDDSMELLQPEIAKTGLELLGVIPLDPLVTRYDTEGKPLFDLPADSSAVLAVNKILDQVGL